MDVSTIVDALETSGVYQTVTLLDPVTITQIAVNLASAYSPNEFTVWLGFYAAACQVETSELAVSVMAVLAECGSWWPDIAARCRAHVRQLVTVAA